MLNKKDKAAHCAQQAAQTNNQQYKAYRNSVSVSRAKLEVGELLLTLQTPLSQEQQKKYWQLFGVMLRQYVDLKFIEVTG